MALDDRVKAAFDAAGETIKQLLTLATGSIGAAVALFVDKDKPGIDFGRSAGWVDAGLVLLSLSVAFGLLALGALTGQLGNKSIADPSPYSPALRVMTIGQMATYGFGIALLVVAAIR